MSALVNSFFSLTRRSIFVKSRHFSVSSNSLNRFFDVPDNAPTLEENTEWLNSLQGPNKNLSQLDDYEYTYIVRDKSDLEDSEKNSEFIRFRSKKTKTVHTVVKAACDEDPYHILSIPASDYFLSSSPFSSLNAKRRPKAESVQSFSDLRVVKLKSGRGGDGEVSFFRDAGISAGPPDGGDGGDGGDVYVMASKEISSLHNIRSRYIAQDGTKGKKGQLDGKKGDSVYITVPVGTHIRWCPDPKEIRSLRNENTEEMVFHVKAVSDEYGSLLPKFIQLFRNAYKIGEGWIFKEKDDIYHSQKEYFTDLNEKVKQFDARIRETELLKDTFPIDGVDLGEVTEEPLLLLKGGKGGLGNMHFLTPMIRNPRFAKMGREGLEEHFIFELKLLADLGLVGLPNAGKSTLLRAISNAKPRVGHWEFTTLQPSIGTIQIRIDQPPFTVADIPGIVKGAKHNKGMGLNFLRHIERSGGLVFVVSLGSRNPVDDITTLVDELEEHRIEGKNVLVVATKADIDGSIEKFKVLKQFVEDRGWKIVPCSGLNKENIEKVIQLMAECSGKYI
ncbi:hypothetical protein CANINC_002267 [Pichia inconspicua]|uniref:Obg family GTPase CgtA n=1 Tax=Pichia inconspicua TaxID=52247 RepID=A0A4T0X394_9ASCO|nr:hypothetical protein CANINC_002267 [[Candida] inconspicua]